MKFIDLTGQKFSRLTALRLAPKRGKKTAWHCICDCGKETVAIVDALRGGRHRSCGCLHIESITKHGFSSSDPRKVTPIYRTWLGMIQRCTNPQATHFHRYGGRGIKVCERWEKFENFLADMSPRPANKTLDRINNDGNYEPANCQWVTRKQQAQNRTYTPPKVVRGRNELGQFK
jgi:hypothetical protein